MKSKMLFVVVLGSLIVFALSLPVMAQSTSQSTTTTTHDSTPAQTQSTTTTTQYPAYSSGARPLRLPILRRSTSTITRK